MIPYEWIWDTCLTTLLATFILWFTLQLAESTRAIDWCLYGLLWGFALMTNPALGTLLPFLLGWAAYRASGCGRGVWRSRAGGFDAALCCTPWTVRNYLAFHHFVPLRTTFPYRALAWTQPRLRPAIAPDDAGDPYEQGREYQRLGEDAFMRKNGPTRCFYPHPSRARGEPVRAAVRGVLGRALFAAEAISWTQTRWAIASCCWPISSPRRVRSAGWSRYGSGVGATRSCCRHFQSSFPDVLHDLPYLRYRQPIEPVLMLLAALALDALLHRKRVCPARASSARAVP